MKQPNQKVWHLRVAENPRNKGESPFEYYRRMAVRYGCSFENARHKINKHLKQIRLDEVNEKGFEKSVEHTKIGSFYTLPGVKDKLSLRWNGADNSQVICIFNDGE
jgi:hypothetical protein